MDPYETTNAQQRRKPNMACYMCYSATISMQCRTCGTVKCLECFKGAPQYCQANCSFSDYIPVNPQNDAEHQQLLTLRCRDCLQYYNISEAQEHARQCVARSNTNFTTVSPSIEEPHQTCRYCSHIYNPLELTAHEAQCSARSLATTNGYAVNTQEIGLTTFRRREQPELTPWQKVSIWMTGMISLAAMAVTFYFAIKLIFLNNPHFKAVCVGDFDTDQGICLFAFGQFAVGIITFSQIGVGFIHIGQVGIGLLFGIGQVTSGIGFSIGQVASATYVHRVQLGIAFYAIGKAQIGFEFLRALLKRKTPVVQGCC